MSKKPKKPTKKEKGQKSESKKIPVPSHPKISDASLLRVPEDALPGHYAASLLNCISYLNINYLLSW